MIKLQDFLKQQEELKKENRLSSEKIEVLKMASKFADDIYKDGKIWFFSFDEGVYQGSTIIRIPQIKLTPLALLNALDSINWPGFKIIVSNINDEIMKMLRR